MRCAEEIDWSDFTFQHGFRQPKPKLFELAPAVITEQKPGEAEAGTPAHTDIAAAVKQEGDPVKMEVDGSAQSPVKAEQVGCSQFLLLDQACVTKTMHNIPCSLKLLVLMFMHSDVLISSAVVKRTIRYWEGVIIKFH